MLIMPNPRDYVRRLAPRDPRDRARYIFVAVCAVATLAFLVLLLAHGR